MHSSAWWLTLALTLVVLGIATVTDLRSRRIPNWLVLPFLAAGLAVNTSLHGWQGLGQSLEGAGLGLLVYGILFWMGGMGAGDVKLCTAIGAWIGPQQQIFAVVITAMAGGLMVLGWAAYRGFLKDLFTGAGNHMRRKIPYAPAIAVGTLISFFTS
jgi:prepilin peptidase CpaA